MRTVLNFATLLLVIVLAISATISIYKGHWFVLLFAPIGIAVGLSMVSISRKTSKTNAVTTRE